MKTRMNIDAILRIIKTEIFEREERERFELTDALNDLNTLIRNTNNSQETEKLWSLILFISNNGWFVTDSYKKSLVRIMLATALRSTIFNEDQKRSMQVLVKIRCEELDDGGQSELNIREDPFGFGFGDDFD